MDEIDEQWYWDRRNKKTYYPVEADDDTVVFATVWHREEVTDALSGDALVPIDDLGPDHLDGLEAGFDHFDSFRLPDEVRVGQMGDE